MEYNFEIYLSKSQCPRVSTTQLVTFFPYTQEYKYQETTTKQYGGKD